MTTILLKNKNTSAVPTAGDLTNAAGGAELALNVADKRMYAKDGSGNVVEMGTNPSAITAASITDSGLTATRVVFAGVGGLLSDSANMTFNGTTLSLNALSLSNALTTANGGTGLTSFTAGDITYYASGTALSKLAIGTNGQILTSNGTAPTWSSLSGVAVTTFSAGTTGFTPSTATSGAITLAGTLATTNGGTGLTSFTSGGAVYASSTSALTTGTLPTTAGGTGLTSFTSGGAVYASSTSALTTGTLPTTAGGTGLTSFTSGGAVYASSTSALTTGTLPVTAGGSGATTLTGILKGNGTSAFTAATAGTDYVAPGTATTFTATQTFSGSTSVKAMKTSNIAEVDTISATAATGTINFDITTQSVLYYTTNASANWTVNFRGSSGTSLDSLMATGESISATFLVTQGSTAYYNSAVTIDGSSVTPKWQGGTAPTSGNASSVDCYTYVIQKTGSATFAVLASQTKFA